MYYPCSDKKHYYKAKENKNRWHQLQHCLEKENQYLLLVQWETLEAHTVGFRGSEQYQEWRKLLHPFYDPFPTVEHYEVVQNYPER